MDAAENRWRASFTLAHNPEVDTMIREALDFAAERIGAFKSAIQPAAVVLGGGYGRGEGGVLQTADGFLPYNDLDFFVLTDGMSRENMAGLDRELAGISEQLASRLHLDVDFAPARDVSALPELSCTLMYQEMLAGHVTVFGSDEALAGLKPLQPEQLPYLEALRLFLNRGAGLFFALEKLAKERQTSEDLDFIVRNLHKCSLGCGDALLLAGKKYVYNLEGRLAALADFKPAENILALYRAAAAFKARPAVTSSVAECRERAELLRSRWAESLRLTLSLMLGDNGAKEKALSDMRLGNGRMVKHWLLNLRYMTGNPFNAGAFMPPQYRVLAMLKIILEIWPKTADWERFRKLWGRFN